MTNKIIITGAGQRIGLFLTNYLISLNYYIIAVVRTPTKELSILQNLYPGRIEIIQQDFTRTPIDDKFWKQLSHKKIIGFIHCASTFYYDTVSTASNSKIKEQQLVNCNVFIDACTSFCQNIKETTTPASFIAFLDSKLERLNSDHYSYTLSKLQLKASIPFLAMSCAPKIRVNAISPGLVLRSGEQTEEEFKIAQNEMPFGYGANLEDISQTTAFLLMQNSVTGQIINVDAGQHLIADRDIIFK